MNRALIERTLAAMDKGYMGHHHAEYAAVMEALKEELEKPEPEPVAYWIPKADQFCVAKTDRPFAKAWEPLYTKGTTNV